ncbi:MAG: inner membrane CreD family protein, partial [Pseudomonadota bacterium]
RTWALLASLGGLYGTLYWILQSEDHALLAGSILAFIAVALAMMMTRGEDWSKPGGAKQVNPQPA